MLPGLDEVFAILGEEILVVLLGCSNFDGFVLRYRRYHFSDFLAIGLFRFAMCYVRWDRIWILYKDLQLFQGLRVENIRGLGTM